MNEKTLEKLGLKDDPFDIRNPSQKLIGEEEQEKKLIKFISQSEALLLYGQTGSGKTTMITNLSRKINDEKIEELEGCRCIVYGDKDNLKDFSRRLWKHRLFSFGKPLIVMLDEIAYANEDDLMVISAAWDKKKIKSVVYAQISDNIKYDKLWRRIGKDFKVEMRVISELEIYEMLKLRQGNLKLLSDNSLKYVSYNCGNSPSLALQRCSWIVNDLGEPSKEIPLEDVKMFYQKNIKNVQLPKSKETAAEEPKDMIDRLDLFPLEKQIIRQLRISSMTMKQLSEALKTDLNTISSRISNLKKHKKVLVLDKKRPQKYGLVPAFERSLLTDVKENPSSKKEEDESK